MPHNTPPGVGADSSRPYPNITKYTYPHYQIRISTLPHTHFPSTFRVCFPICGHDKSAPTAADGLQQRCEQIAIYTRTPTKHHTFAPQIPYFRTTNTILSHRKNLLFATQIPTSCTAKTYFSHYKNHTFARQKPICDKLGGSQKRFVKIIIVAETNISHTPNKTLSSLLEYHFLNHYNRLYRVRITI
ncbi:hypothetical protein [Prevotella pallens]